MPQKLEATNGTGQAPPTQETIDADAGKKKTLELLLEYDKLTKEQQVADAYALMEVRRLLQERSAKERGVRPRVYRPARKRRRPIS